MTQRGIDGTAGNEWQLGYVLDPLPGHEQFKGRLSIPYVTPTGAVDIKFRCIQHEKCSDHGCTKYMGEAGFSSRMFGVLSLRADSPFILVCEGELDTIAAVELGGVPAVGINGVNKWKPHYPYLFEGFSEVVVACDGDDAGVGFGEKVSTACHNARSVSLPKGEDVNSFLVKHGAKAFRERCGLDGGEIP